MLITLRISFVTHTQMSYLSNFVKTWFFALKCWILFVNKEPVRRNLIKHINSFRLIMSCVKNVIEKNFSSWSLFSIERFTTHQTTAEILMVCYYIQNFQVASFQGIVTSHQLAAKIMRYHFFFRVIWRINSTETNWTLNSISELKQTACEK